MKIDSIYTPSALARAMVDAAGVSLGAGHLIADFAAGSGELLNAAQSKWPLAQIVATDIDSTEARFLRVKNNGWQIGICDFLDPKSRNGSSILRRLVGKTKLVILNPPFSCRGGKKVVASASAISVKCSVGLAFVVNSIDYLAAGGPLVAILPLGSLSSEKDAEAWNLLRKLGTVETVMYNGHRTFQKATVDTVVIRLVKAQEGEEQFDQINEGVELDVCENYEPDIDIKLVRGNIQMDEIENPYGLESVTLIHSTDLKEGNISNGRSITNGRARLVTGPMVLIPRVGRPKKEKVVCYTGEGTFALSDCVLALLCPSKHVAKQTWESLIQNWNLLEQAYSGSGAKYITIKKYIRLLRQLGYHIKNVEPNRKEMIFDQI